MSEQEVFAAAIDSVCQEYGHVERGVVDCLWAHYQLLRRWNRAMNLTALEEVSAAAKRHYAESLLGAWALPPGSFRIADVGSGPGFPGVVVAAARPECTVHLIESQKKKAAFLREACDALPNVRVYAIRSQQFSEAIDWVISRAVRWEETIELAARLGASVCLWCSLEDAQTVARQQGWNWRDPWVLPGTERSCLALGDFPRET